MFVATVMEGQEGEMGGRGTEGAEAEAGIQAGPGAWASRVARRRSWAGTWGGILDRVWQE